MKRPIIWDSNLDDVRTGSPRWRNGDRCDTDRRNVCKEWGCFPSPKKDTTSDKITFGSSTAVMRHLLGHAFFHRTCYFNRQRCQFVQFENDTWQLPRGFYAVPGHLQPQWWLWNQTCVFFCIVINVEYVLLIDRNHWRDCMKWHNTRLVYFYLNYFSL